MNEDSLTKAYDQVSTAFLKILNSGKLMYLIEVELRTFWPNSKCFSRVIGFDVSVWETTLKLATHHKFSRNLSYSTGCLTWGILQSDRKTLHFTFEKSDGSLKT